MPVSSDLFIVLNNDINNRIPLFAHPLSFPSLTFYFFHYIYLAPSETLDSSDFSIIFNYQIRCIIGEFAISGVGLKAGSCRETVVTRLLRIWGAREGW